MAIFKRLEVPRTKVADKEDIWFEPGRAGFGFYKPGAGPIGWQMVPHDNKWLDGTRCFMAPVSHFHLLQSESFHVVKGSGYWFLGGRKIRLGAGEDIHIPACRAHTFESIPNDKEEHLLIEYRYDAQRWEMEERFFRNALTYLDDCRRHGVEPSLPQICIFLADCWMPGDFIQFPGGDYVSCVGNLLFTFVFAFVGLVFYGYKRSYIEYYDPVRSRRRILEWEKKGK